MRISWDRGDENISAFSFEGKNCGKFFTLLAHFNLPAFL